MQEVIIINNKFYLKKDNNFISTELKKLFIKDKIHKDKIVESKYRKEQLIGYFSTSQTIVFGKTNSNKSFYKVTPFIKKLPPFIIAYGGKLKGKILLKFKFLNWNDKLPRGEIIEVIGLMNENNLTKTLLYHYQIYSKKYNYEANINENEKNINRIFLKNKEIISVDPINSKDIDDGISLEITDEFYIVGIHIAQPIYWLSEKDILKTMKTKFSTIYIKNNQSNLWGNNITTISSLLKNKKRPAYTIEFKIYMKTDSIVETKSYPSWVKLKDNISYTDKNKMIDKLFLITKKWDKSILNYQELISYWMIKTNNYIGIKIKDSGLPFRVNHLKNNNIKLPPLLKNIFKSKNIQAAYYSRDEYEHKSLNLNYYTHFTSPIRRLVDTIVHYYLTYNKKIRIDLDKINLLDSNIKKFHRIINLKYILDNMNSKIEDIAYLYRIIYPNLWEVFIERFGFVKMEVFNKKLEYQFEFIQDNDKYILKNKDNETIYKIGDKIEVYIEKIPGYFPNEKLKITPKVSL